MVALRISLALQSFIKEGGLGLDPVVVGRGKQMQRNLPRYNTLPARPETTLESPGPHSGAVDQLLGLEKQKGYV